MTCTSFEAEIGDSVEAYVGNKWLSAVVCRVTEYHVKVKYNRTDKNRWFSKARVRTPQNVDEKPQEGEEPCVVCNDNARIMVFVPCGHRHTCYTCTQRLDKCPTCRADVQSSLRVFT